jgi:hypothetical protein
MSELRTKVEHSFAYNLIQLKNCNQIHLITHERSGHTIQNKKELILSSYVHLQHVPS